MLAACFALVFLFVGVYSQGTLSVGVNSDGSSSFGGRVPITGNKNGELSAFASIARPSGDITKGLSLETSGGHGLSLAHGTTFFGEQLTGAGKLNIINNGNHKLDANAFLTRNMPTKFDGVPNFNTVGGNLDYMFKDRIGASIGAARTPFLGRTDLNAMGKLNLFRSPTTSLDFNAGLQKTITPQFSQTQPFTGFTLNRFFGGGK